MMKAPPSKWVPKGKASTLSPALPVPTAAPTLPVPAAKEPSPPDRPKVNPLPIRAQEVNDDDYSSSNSENHTDEDSIHSYDSRANRDQEEDDDNNSIHSYDSRADGDDDSHSKSINDDEFNDDEDVGDDMEESDHSYSNNEGDEHENYDSYENSGTPQPQHMDDGAIVSDDDDHESDHQSYSEEDDDDNYDHNASNPSRGGRFHREEEDDDVSYADNSRADSEMEDPSEYSHSDHHETHEQGVDASYSESDHDSIRDNDSPNDDDDGDDHYDENIEESFSDHHDMEYDNDDGPAPDESASIFDVDDDEPEENDDSRRSNALSDQSYDDTPQDDHRSHYSNNDDDHHHPNEDRSYASGDENDDDNDPSYESDGQENHEDSYGSSEHDDNDEYDTHGDDPNEDRSYASGNENDDDNDPSYESDGQENQEDSYGSSEHDDNDEYNHNTMDRPNEDDEMTFEPPNQPDHTSEHRDEYYNDDDDQLYRSDEGDDDQSYRSGDEPSYVSGDDPDNRSYVSGDDPENRSYVSGDERSQDQDDGRSYHSRDQDDNDDDDRSYRSGEEQGDDRSYVSGESQEDNNQSHGIRNQDDNQSYSSGEEDSIQLIDDDAYDDNQDDQSYRSGEEDDNQSYYSDEDDENQQSAHEDDGDRSYYSGDEDDQERRSAHHDDEYSSYSGDRGDNDDYHDDQSYDNNEPTSESPVQNRVYSNESMPMIELDEVSDTENDDESYERSNTRNKHEHFYHEGPSFSSKINLPMDTSESTGASHLETSRRQESVNQSVAASNKGNNTDARATNEHKPVLYYDDNQSNESFGDDNESDTCNSNSLNDFDSFAYDASATSLLRDSVHKKLQLSVGVESIDTSEEVSVVSALPIDLHSPSRSQKPHMAEADTRIGTNHSVLQPPSVGSNKSSSSNKSEERDGSIENSQKKGEKSSNGKNEDSTSSRSPRSGASEYDSDSRSEEESMSGSFGGDGNAKSPSPRSSSIEHTKQGFTDTSSNGSSKSKSDQGEASQEESDQQSESGSAGPLQLPKPKVYNGYTREQMTRLIQKEQAADTGRRKRSRGRGKISAVVEFISNVHNAVTTGEKEHELNADTVKPAEDDKMLTSSRLLYAFEALAGIFLQLSDEMELLKTFAAGKVSPAIETLESLLAFSEPLNDAIQKLEPILIHHVTEEIDEELDDFLYGMNLIVDLLCELGHRVGEKQMWNARANTSFVTLLELLARDTLEVCCIFDDVDTPEYEPTDMIQDAWEATGHVEEIKTLMDSDDLFIFRQICYEVILSTDQWCPDNNILMDICGIDAMSIDEQAEHDEDELMASPPEAALQILEKIHGDPLPRTSTLASVIRRLLPADAITDSVISENFARIRNSVRNPIGIPPSSLVTITSTPESYDDPDALGVAGVGKTTIAAMVACHDDILRFYNDGIAWIYVGEIELNYNRYVQCLQDLLSQLEVDEDEEPLFPELLHIPGESQTMRKRREEGFMIYLRETIVEFLRYRNVLIILDDVCFEPDLDWFDFAPAPPDDDEEIEDEGTYAILVTSRRRNLLPPADTVEVDMLDEAEGIRLLVGESGDIAQAVDVDAEVTKSVVRECAGHPLTIKSVGRWLNLKHATTESVEIAQKTHKDVINSMEKILKNELQDGNDMVYEILNMSLCPAINGEPTTIIKLCFAAFVRVFCQRKHISDFALADSTPIVPMASTELLFESLLDLEEDTLLQEGSIFHAQKKEAAKLIPEILASLGVFKVIITYAEAPEDSSVDEEEDEKYLQIMHRIQQEYGEHLYEEDPTLTELTKDGERRWNKAFAKSFNARDVDWDTQTPDAGLDYALEMLPSHMMRGGLLMDTVKLLRNEKFIRGRLSALGRENGSRRHIKDSELLFDLLAEKRASGQKKVDPKGSIRLAYDTLGRLLKMGEDEFIEEEGSPEAVEVGRCHFEIGFSLAERRCWEGAITHWELSQEFLVVSLGMVELVAGLLFNIAIVYAEMQDYDMALSSLKQCLRIRGAIHGEEHILYAQTIQKIGDVFLAMSDYHEAIESYDWALDVMHIEPSHYRINIGDILEQIGSIHYIKGEIEDSLQSYQDALRSKQIDLGEDHPELAQIFHHIGNCLSNLGKTDEAIAHLEEAIRLKQLDAAGGYEGDSDILTIEGILNNLNFRQKEGLECYEKALQILVTKVPHKKEKVAALLHLVGCVYLMSGEHKKALKLFEESLYARRKVLGFVHLEVASTLFNMAFLHQSRNRLDKALKCLEESLRIRQLRLPDSEKVAVTHEKIGNLARAIGKTKKAENAFNDALRIRKLIHGSSHEAVATVLQELGDLMDDLGEYENAMKHYVEALEIRENRLGPDDLAVAETYYSMGFTLQNNGALDRALQCLEESLSIRKFQLGDDSKEVGDTLNMMGFLQAKRGELDDALALLWDALRIRKLQDDNIKVSETLNNIGNVHREKQEYDLSIECYEECLRIRRAELGDGHEKVADALIALGNVQSDLEYNEEAMDSFKEGTLNTPVIEF